MIWSFLKETFICFILYNQRDCVFALLGCCLYFVEYFLLDSVIVLWEEFAS